MDRYGYGDVFGFDVDFFQFVLFFTRKVLKHKVILFFFLYETYRPYMVDFLLNI
jgi:hypothetical protein